MYKRKKTYLMMILMMCSAVLFSCKVQDRKKVQSSPDKPQATPTTAPVYSLEGKTFVFLGSSVTFGSASGGWSMCEYLEENFNCTIQKSAISGTTLTEYATNSYVSRMKQIEKRESLCDHFICQLSTNDASNKLPLGEVSDSKNKEDFDTKTIIGAMEYIIAAAQEKWGCHVSFYTGTKYENEYYKKMIDALYELKEKWDIGIIDLWNDKEMNSVAPKDYARYMSDPIHPTKAGYEEWWGPKFAEYLQTYK